MPTILIVDDEPSIIDALRYNLEKLHYHVLISMDGEDALTTARNKNPDLIVLDLMLPGVDGIEVCRELRTESAVPIIMLTARDEEIDRVVGLELGADDYVVKPFSMRELMARIKSVLRRSSSQMMDTDRRLQNSELQIS
ncbi:MAG: response regulator, partial [Anaerolineales bacterium]